MFTISVGNLPPAAAVLVKVTFVSELVVKDGSVLFSLPGSVAPWQESAALNQTTQVRAVLGDPSPLFSLVLVTRRFHVFSVRRQVTMEKVCVTEDAAASR